MLFRSQQVRSIVEGFQWQNNSWDLTQWYHVLNLEIEADDVRCSHGATVGQVDETQLFYLMSRGLSRPEAERLLVLGFFDEVLSRVPLEGTRERIREAIELKIGVSR